MQFRSLIFDYPLRCLDKGPWVRDLLGDIIKSKQQAFLQTNENYVVMDKHDMIGTHFLIFDVTNLYTPKLVLAIRNTYENRAKEHGLQLPIDGYIQLAGLKAIRALEQMRMKHNFLVDCNSWFVHPEYSHKNSGLKLSELGFLLVVTYILRRGMSHFVGAGNEKYKVSRWVKQVGFFPEGLFFKHPMVPDTHCVTLVDEFNKEWLIKAVNDNKEFLLSSQEIIGGQESIKSISDLLNEIMNWYQVAA
ncbi:MAG: hypothetical protein K1X29_08410 [Bdellovibrionales bacterium]|nr:hypothetical protein [Bdellovibrionales bacterium]